MRNKRPAKTPKPKAPAARPAITRNTSPDPSPEEKLKVWVRAGGRCCLCNHYVLEDDFHLVPIGEAAHIVGRVNSPRSPRGQDPLPLDERSRAENLMLLCANEHKSIDDKIRSGELGVDWLREQKRRHEDRIHHLTGLGFDRQTAIIRMLGRVRGAHVELRREHAQRVVREYSDRFAHFPLSMGRDSLEIDLLSLPDPEDWTDHDGYWTAARRAIDDRLQILLDGARRQDIPHLSVFAFARIPLLIHLGYSLGDKIPMDIYQKHRGGDESWDWTTEAAVPFAWANIRKGSDPARVALVLSLSGTIHVHELPPGIDETFNVFEIAPLNVKPNRDIMKARASLDSFAACYHDFLSALEVGHKGARSIHLFPAIPLAAAIACGRGVMRDAQPALAVYDRSNSGFKFALEVNAS